MDRRALGYPISSGCRRAVRISVDSRSSTRGRRYHRCLGHRSRAPMPSNRPGPRPRRSTSLSCVRHRPTRPCPPPLRPWPTTSGLAGVPWTSTRPVPASPTGSITAAALVSSGVGNVLLVGAETMTRVTNWEDRSSAFLFGDGAGAVVLKAVPGPGALLGCDLGADGSLVELLYADHGSGMVMRGKEIFRQAVRVTTESANASLRRAGVEAREIALFVPHQANRRIMDAVAERLGIPANESLLSSSAPATPARLPSHLPSPLPSTVADSTAEISCCWPDSGPE